MTKLLLTLAFISVALSACQTMKSETVQYKSKYSVKGGFGVGDETLNMDFFTVTLSGKLWLPEGDGPFPVVFWGHPSTISESRASWRNSLRSKLIENGIGIFFNNSIEGRGFGRKRPTDKYGHRLNSDSYHIDAVLALGTLAKHPKTDPKRIGISGESIGANTAMWTQWEDYMAQMQPDNLRFAAHVPISPPCDKIIKDYKSTGAPMLILTGEKDWNYANRCRDRVAERREAGAKIDLVIYPDAYHCFIASFPPKVIGSPVYGDCGTVTIDKKRGVRWNNHTDRGYPYCIRFDGICGGNSAATADALKRTVAFFSKHL